MQDAPAGLGRHAAGAGAPSPLPPLLPPEREPAPAPRPIMSEKRTAWLGALLVGLGPVSLPLFAPALPALTQHFGVSTVQGKAALTGYLAGYISMQLVAGPLSDRLGRKPVALAFCALFICASCATLMVDDMRGFLIARILQGIGASAGVSVGRAIVLDQFDAKRSISIMTLISLILAVGPAIAPVLGGGLTYFGGWIATLAAMLVMGIGQGVVIWLCLRETRARRPAAGGFGIGVFGPMLSSRSFLYGTLCTAGATTAYNAQAVLLPFLLVETLGHSALTYALATLVVAVVYIIGNWLSRQFQNNQRQQTGLVLGVWLMAVAAAVYLAAWAVGAVALGSVVVVLSLSAAAGALVFPTMIPLTLVPFRDRPGAAASLNMFLQLLLALLITALASALSDPVAGLGLAFTAATSMMAGGYLLWRKRMV